MNFLLEAFSEIVPGLPESIVRIAIGGVNSPRNVLSYASLGLGRP